MKFNNNMYKKISLSILILCIQFAAIAQTHQSTLYPVVLQFQSECCGVPADTSLKLYVQSFRKKYKIKKKLKAVHIGPMGKEGEYWLAFSLKELNKKQRSFFINQLKPVVIKLKDPGSVTLIENMSVQSSDLPSRATSESDFF